jgi:hypothetical protein
MKGGVLVADKLNGIRMICPHLQQRQDLVKSPIVSGFARTATKE